MKQTRRTFIATGAAATAALALVVGYVLDRR